MAEFVFALVAALAKTVAALTFTAEEPPTEATVAATEPDPLAVTSPVRAEIPVPEGVVHDKAPAPSVVRTWFTEPAVRGSVSV